MHMENLFDKYPIVPRGLKMINAYGEYMLEVRGDVISQQDIRAVFQRQYPNYRDVIVYMKNWGRTNLGFNWWTRKADELDFAIDEIKNRNDKPI